MSVILQDNLGPYRLESKVGEGPLGYVMRAVDKENKQTVAIKILHDRFLSTPIQRHFYNKARDLFSVNVPGVVKIRKVMPTGQDNNWAVVMDWVDHVPIDQLSTYHKIIVLKHVAQTLVSLHEAGYVHGNLKPSNILVQLLADDTVATHLTDVGYDRPSMVDGPLEKNDYAYLSPEHVKGDSVIEQSDWFSFGVLLYKFTSGHFPFDFTDPATVAGEITWGRRVPIKDVCPHLPDFVAQFVDRLLEPKAEERYVDRATLAQDLDKVFRDPYFITLNPEPEQMDRVRIERRLSLMILTFLISIGALIATSVSVLSNVLINEQIDESKRQALIIVPQFAPDALGDNWTSAEVRMNQLLDTNAFHFISIIDRGHVIRSDSRAGLVGQSVSIQGDEFKRRIIVRHIPFDPNHQWSSFIPISIASILGIPDYIDVSAPLTIENHFYVGRVAFRMDNTQTQQFIVYMRLFAVILYMGLGGLLWYLVLRSRTGLVSLIGAGVNPPLAQSADTH